MTDFFLENTNKIYSTIATLVAFIIIRFIIIIVVRRIGRLNNFVKGRVKLTIKYMVLILAFIIVGIITFIWGVNFEELALLFSSMFAILGIALFAQWSILSNLSAGIILFFAFPFKIGDRVKILDKDIDGEGPYLIEDIKAFHVTLRSENGGNLIYPNSLMMQKPISVIGSKEF